MPDEDPAYCATPSIPSGIRERFRSASATTLPKAILSIYAITVLFRKRRPYPIF